MMKHIGIHHTTEMDIRKVQLSLALCFSLLHVMFPQRPLMRHNPCRGCNLSLGPWPVTSFPPVLLGWRVHLHNRRFSISLSLAANSDCLYLAVFLCVQTAWPAVFGIFSMCTDVDACDCTQGLYRHHKSLHWKLTLGERKKLATPWTQTWVSIASGFSVGRSTNWVITHPPTPLPQYLLR